MNRNLTVSSRSTLFQSGTYGYHTFRIPALVTLSAGVVMVAAEGRRDAVRDWGQIDLVVRRSIDGGRTFDEPRTVITAVGFTSGNPTWVFDPETGVLALLFCRNVADQHEALVFEGKAARTVWVSFSYDAGLSFSEPREITQQVKPANWTWYATGPGHGLRLTSGRWVVPCCHAVAATTTHDDPVRSHIIVSEDCGVTWQVGGIVDVPRSSECGVAEVRPNEVYLDFRHDEAPNNRGGAYSTDGGTSFVWRRLHEHLTDPGCRGGVTSGVDPNHVWLSHALGPKRRDLVLEHSSDGGRSFRQVLLLAPGCAAYSDLVCSGNRLLCAFETGEATPYERIDWLTVE